jgi:hypothetical protein
LARGGPEFKAACRLPGRLDRGQQQGDQDRDDRDDHQQLDQREAAMTGVLDHGDMPPSEK